MNPSVDVNNPRVSVLYPAQGGDIATDRLAITGQDAGSAPEVDWDAGRWLNKPAHVAIEDRKLMVRTDDATDFWRETYYGFVRDNGHFLGFTTAGEFTAQMHLRGRFDHLYDQAGIMLRAGPDRWIKTGVEFTDGKLFLSTVVTNGASDWSVMRFDCDVSSVWLRLTLQKGAARISASTDGKTWPLLRLAPFMFNSGMLVGPMACTPERGDLRVEFSHLTIGRAMDTDLHDLS